MNGTHPPAARFAMFVIALACLVGCQTHPTAMTNPFATPNRVPPPATRTLLPGEAAPYYQGDPLPAMQGAAPARDRAGEELAQNERAAGEDSSAPATPPADRLAFAGDSAVNIPQDDGPLRFPPPPRPAAPQPAVSSVAAAPQERVTPAIFNDTVRPDSPSDVQAPSSGIADNSPAGAASNSLWRSPQVIRQATAGALVPFPAYPANAAPYMVGQPGAAAAGGDGAMGVRLRAVGSPPTGEAPAPRIRLPGYAPPTAAPDSVQQAAYYFHPGGQAYHAAGVVAYSPGGMPAAQTVQITPLQEAPLAPTSASTIAAAGRDGFRPRGSVR